MLQIGSRFEEKFEADIPEAARARRATMRFEQFQRNAIIDNEQNAGMTDLWFGSRRVHKFQMQRHILADPDGNAAAHQGERSSAHWLFASRGESAKLITDPRRSLRVQPRQIE